MKEVKNCKIVQDLLPNYIEKLTNEETNLYIENHLNQCEECKNIYNNMKKELDLKTVKRDKRDVKYIKKYNHKLRVLKILLAIILIIFILIIGDKFIIIKSLQGKIENYKNKSNFHTTINSYKGDILEISNIYHKDEKYLINIKSINGRNTREMISTENGNTYITSDNDKIAILGNSHLEISDEVYNYLETDSIAEALINLFTSHIISVKLNDKDCYKIDNFKSDELYPKQGFCVYIDKATGLLVRSEKGEKIGNEIFTIVTDYSYEFDTVIDEDIKEPDIKEYTVQQ